MARKITKRQTAQPLTLDMRNDCTALYIRVSTEKQADEGFSLDAQQERLTAYCAAHEWAVCRTYVDAGVSGKTANRPEFQRMMDAAKNGEVSRIVAIKLDRLARNTRDFLATVDQLHAAGCDLVLVHESFDTSTPHGKFALTMFAAIAELEASQIAERTRAGRTEKARQGGFNGAPAPLGYDYDGETFTVNRDEARTVQRIFDQFTAGASLNGIARELNAADVQTKTGARWYASTVRHILSNGFYAGITQYTPDKKRDPDIALEVAGDHPPIITRNCYESAWNRLHRLQPGRPHQSPMLPWR